MTQHLTHDTWHLTCDTWYVKHDTSHVTCDTRLGLNILSNFSSLALMVWDLWRLERKGSPTELMNQSVNFLLVCFVQLFIFELNHIFCSVVLLAHCPRQHWLLLKILEKITALTFQLLIPPLCLLPGLKNHWILHDPSPHTPGDSVASAPPLTLSPLPGATATSASEAPPPSLHPPHPPPITTSTSNQLMTT